MKKVKLKYIIFSIIAFIFVIGINTRPVMAANGTVSASGGGRVQIGDTVNISVSFNADETLYGLKYGITYDPNVLEFMSGSGANGGSGTVNVALALSSDSGSSSVKFKAISSGTSNISVSNAIGVGVSDFQMQSSGGTSVTVGAASSPNLSRDNSLKSLTISPGSLSPNFSYSTTRYTATVSKDTTSLVVSASPSHSTAEVVSVTGAENLSVGTNNVRVVVEAEDGSTATYTIVVTREGTGETEATTEAQTEETAETAETEETETGETEETETNEPINTSITVDGRKVLINSDFESSSMPESFRKVSVTYNGEEISVASSITGDLTLFYLTDEDGENGEFYIHDNKRDTFILYTEVEGRGGRFIILPLGEDLIIPDNFVKTTFNISVNEVEGWQLEGLEDSDYYIVYAMDGKGNKELFSYDNSGNTFQRFSVDAMNALLGKGSDNNDEVLPGDVSTLQEDLDKTNADLSNLQGKYNSDMRTRLYAILSLAVLSVLLVVILINVLLRNRFLKADLHEYEYVDNELEISSNDESSSYEEDFYEPTNESVETDKWNADELELDTDELVDDNIVKSKAPIVNPIEDIKEDGNPDIKAEKIDDLIQLEEVDEVTKDKEVIKDKTKEISDLENASLEDIFEFLNIEDLDD